MKQQWSSLIVVVLAVVAIVLLFSSTAMAVSTTVVIGEFRTRGPNGGNDETVSQNQSYARLPDTLSQTGGRKNGVDTDNNSADFVFNVGTSSPENTGSPLAVTLRTLSASNNASDLALPIALASVSLMAVIALRRRNRAA